MSARLAGLLLFLPVPVVLVLFTRAPLGLWPSLTLGVALMATHRLYARPFALARAEQRCLWCGGEAGPSPSAVEIDEPGAHTAWRCCRPDHERPLRGLLSWAARRALLVRVGILGSLLAFLLLSVLAGLGHGGPFTFADASALFRLGVALTVLPLGWRGPSAAAPGTGALRSPFPVHIQALLGSLWVVWLFRLVGLAWLAQALLHLAQRVI